MKKILAFLIAVFISVSVILMPIYADSSTDSGAMTKQDYELWYLQYVSWLEQGEITEEEFYSEVEELTDDFVSSNTSSDGILSTVAQNAVDTVEKATETIRNGISACGNAVLDLIDELFNNYTATTTTTNVDLLGYNALLYTKTNKSNGSYLEKYYYCDYIICNPDDSSGLSYTVCKGDLSNILYKYNNVFGDDAICHESYMNYNHTEHVERDDDIWAVYGDVRYEDGTQAPSEDVTITTVERDFSGLDESELNDLINELIETIERENPDFSTIEGLLEAIYYRLGTLDSDNDNTILGQIVSAINSLENSIKNISFESITEKIENNEINLSDIFGDFKFSIEFGDFFIALDSKINFYFTFQTENYFDTKIAELKNDFKTEFAFIDNISAYVENLFNAFEALWEEEE